MTFLRLGLVVVAVLTVLGCQGGAGSFQTVRLPSDDYARTFEVTRQVLGESFVVEQADSASGRIVTSPQAVPEPESVVGTVLDLPGVMSRARRTVTAQVSRGEGSTRVSVRVQLEVAQAVQGSSRPTYDEYDPTVTGGESDIHRAPEEKIGVVWKRAGSDVEMEKQLLAEIGRSLRHRNAGPDGLKSGPEGNE